MNLFRWLRRPAASPRATRPLVHAPPYARRRQVDAALRDTRGRVIGPTLPYATPPAEP